MTDAASATVFQTRNAICNVLAGRDKRLIVVVGPCSIHDTKAARDYANRLKETTAALSNELIVVMRVYFEKPRTTIGWKGLINDPYLDQSYKINDGLRLARRLLLDLGRDGCACRNRVSRHDFTAVCCRPGELGGDWRAHHGEPDSSPVGLRPLLPGGLQKCNLGGCANRD